MYAAVALPPKIGKTSHHGNRVTLDHSPVTRTIRSFVRREGRMTGGQLRALQSLWPKYGLEPGAAIDPVHVFGRRAPLVLEIGFGNGDALLAMAQSAPHEDFIGIEVHRPGVGHLLLALELHALQNVRIFNEDAVRVLQIAIPDGCLDRVLLLFPDPWHKKRHHKRRLVQPAFVELLARKLRPGGILHMATDWEDYAGRMLAVVEASGRFRNCAGTGQYSVRPGCRPATKFERRGQRLGHAVRDLMFERR
jgi:tRNA (guanine-N7-)-methyltransferase